MRQLDLMRLSMRLDEIRRSLNLLEEYLKVMEGFLEDNAEKERGRLAERANELSERARERMAAGEKIGFEKVDTSFRDKLGVQEWELTDQLASILRRSYFIGLYSFLEEHLDQECRNRRGEDVLLALEDIDGTGVTRANTYWEKALGLPFPRNSYWGDIHKGYRLLRNCFVHNGGKLNDRFNRGKITLKRFVDNENLLTLQGEKIILERGFCEKAINTVRRFFETLFAAGSQH